MGQIYITRHGETEWNKVQKMQGHLDSDLTELGERQAIWLRDRLEAIDFKAIYSSPLGRAYKTAELIKGNRELTINKDNRLAEINLGAWQGRSMDEIIAMDSVNYDHFWNSPHLYKSEVGEDFVQLMDRIVGFFKEVASQHIHDVILIIAHAAVLRTLFCYLFHEGDISTLWQHDKLMPASLTILNNDSEGISIKLMADTSHYLEISDSAGWFGAIHDSKKS
jgi:broad specificity phosphatase PhoE